MFHHHIPKCMLGKHASLISVIDLKSSGITEGIRKITSDYLLMFKSRKNIYNLCYLISHYPSSNYDRQKKEEERDCYQYPQLLKVRQKPEPITKLHLIPF